MMHFMGTHFAVATSTRRRCTMKRLITIGAAALAAGVAVAATADVPLYPSDHFPLVATIEFN